jgi:hypothetical protein
MREREKDDDENIFRVFSEISENPSHKSIERRGKRERDEESSRTEKEKKKRRKEKKGKKKYIRSKSRVTRLCRRRADTRFHKR